MHFIGFCIAGPNWHHNGAWRHDESDGTDFLNPARYENIARILEEGKFDGLFFVDVLTLFDTFGGNFAANLRQPGQMFLLEPLQLLACMARATSHLGLAATMSTAFYHPFHIARSMATLDHISGGRAAWNVVTSANDREAQNFGMDRLMERGLRYDHAEEVVEACQALWRSWDEDALVLDRKNGVFADPDKVHYVNFEGRWVKTRGPLQTPRSPQTSPVLMQAGSSERGREFAGRWAEVLFTLQPDKARMQDFYRDIKSRMAAHGRAPNECAILPAVDIIVGETESIAREKAAYLESLVSDELGVAEISNAMGIDLAGYPLDQPLVDMEITQGSRGVFDHILRASQNKNMTLREAGHAYGVNEITPQIVGTPQMIADYMQDLFESEACDGFVVVPTLSPTGYVQFVRSVVPELQRRGIYRTEYAGRTFRENLRS
ncbi:LLM class flavin-dependent oxidoreductase [Ancylobacter sp. MQZ15Z-1]|uniref:LLM class flavin-dependent oxidoreductase n=1 Tax=Ancylobacter mangrovi TaxID=2972472 RepID=A0A9X2T0U7_9HYPH|nr:LLM class flavin-dependent oxidoreductase [Ancylobacter mangrovi]MCS0494032.1 LLM class flavin-dependent oxidoreductase [Ancylobacter mangrovi]